MNLSAKIQFDSPELAHYLKPNEYNIPTDLAKFIVNSQTRMINVKSNYPSKYETLTCDSCKIYKCDQKHLLNCEALKIGNKNYPEYKELFGTNIGKIIQIAKIMKEHLDRKTEALNGPSAPI